MADNETACGNGVQPGPSPGRRCFVGRRNHPNQPTHPRTQTLARFPPDRPGLMASVRRVAIAFHTLVCHIQLARSWVTCRSWSMASPESGEQRPRRAGDHTGLDVRALAWSRNQAVPRRCQGPSAGSADASPRTGSEELTEMGSGQASPPCCGRCQGGRQELTCGCRTTHPHGLQPCSFIAQRARARVPGVTELIVNR